MPVPDALQPLTTAKTPGRNRWVWTSGPDYVYEEDGSPRVDLEPSEAPVDDRGWWTCHPATCAGDLVLLYRSGATGENGVTGTKDLAYLIMVLSDARPLASELYAGEFADGYGCGYQVLERFENPIPIRRLREDPVTASWPALRAGFVQRALPVPEDVWDRILELTDEPAEVPIGPKLARAERRARIKRLERQLEDQLETTPELLAPHGLELVIDGRQQFLGPDHGGRLDLLAHHREDPSRHVVIELKAEEALRDALGQLLGYMGAVAARYPGDTVEGLLIAPGWEPQLSWGLEVPGVPVRAIDSDDVDFR